MSDGAFASDGRALSSTSPGAADRRLKLVIESAPVGLVIAGADGSILAANRTTLNLLRVERREHAAGRHLAEFFAVEDRDRVTCLLAAVCRGETGRIRCVVASSTDDDRPILEIQGVPLRREDAAPTVFLGAIWAITDEDVSAAEAARPAKPDRHELIEALQEARSVHDALAQDRETWSRMQAELSEARSRYETLASRWTLERDALHDRLRDAEERQAALSRQLSEEQGTRQSMFETMELEHQAALLQKTAEAAQLRQAIDALRALHQETVENHRAGRAELDTTIRDLKAHAERDRGQRDALEQQLHAMRDRTAELEDAPARWRRQVADLLAAVRATSVRIEQILAEDGAKGAEPDGEQTWQF